ncbi:hypothetical protein RB595_002583 [Gaeumannomyces hyphopodioides]
MRFSCQQEAAIRKSDLSLAKDPTSKRLAAHTALISYNKNPQSQLPQPSFFRSIAAMTAQGPPPIPTNRLKQIANDACHDAIGSAEFYDHVKTEQWNSQIINSILKAVIAESQPSGSGSTPFKFAVNSTIVQHLVPTSKLNKPTGGAAASEEASSTATSTDGKPHVGRRGMHSATGAYWNDKTDGMWTFKYEGDESKGMDVIVMLVWIGI